MKRLLLALTIAGITVSTATQARLHSPHDTQRALVKAVQQLDLSAEQKQEVRALLTSFRAGKQAQHGNMQAEHARRHTDDTPDAETLRAKLLDNADNWKQKKFQQAQLRHSIYQLLTPDQQNTLEQTDIERHSKRAQRTKSHQDSALPQPFALLALSAQQEQQVAELQSAFRSQAELIRSRMRQFKAQEKALVRSADFSEAAWYTLAESYQPAFIEAAVARASHRAGLLAVLTDAQRQELEALRGANKKHRHHPRRG